MNGWRERDREVKVERKKSELELSMRDAAKRKTGGREGGEGGR
jgi:hypothetical protein